MSTPQGRLSAFRVALPRRAGWVLAVSLAAHLVITVLATDMFDLKVYYQGSPGVLHGTLYDFVLHRSDPHAQPLPFTYPPFAAAVFLPLAALPWPVAAGAWHLLSLGALWLVVHCSFRLLGHPAPARPAMLWTALALWLEPVRHSLGLGQIDLILAAIVLLGLTRRSSLAAGAGVGVAAGLKLVPAVTGLYFLAARRWRAALWSALVFFATVGLAWAVDPGDSHRYWFHELYDTSRVGQVASFENQSLRGAVARTLGHDGGLSALYCVLALGALAGGLLALRAAGRRGETLAMVVTVQLLGLLLGPISWSHHYVWFLPTLICLAHGPLRRGRAGRLAVAAWLVAAGSWVVPAAGKAASHLAPGAAPPWYLVALSWSYPVCAALTFLAVARGGHAPAPAARPRRATPAERAVLD
ncbi:glycosyltransferase 87 family protein [Kitasatospora sp. RB6PN24]|uniref:glycosyltransferase 87 family protein n=1 Tax=Kitasatospora humi TaxID=2893891 RepID=UPI001E374A78|nr:glycosyltransferase 87 family protein [Kitasatospora humi]MCC9307447.1 glycosyltransferase 87 family protein [Kitasatospora humi]